MFSGVINFVGGAAERKTKIGLRIGWKDAALRHLKSGLIGIVYFKTKIRVSESFEVEDQFFDDLAFRFDIVVMLTRVPEVEFEVGRAFFFGDYCVLGADQEDQQEEYEMLEHRYDITVGGLIIL